jgi:hypothetical protein
VNRSQKFNFNIWYIVTFYKLENPSYFLENLLQQTWTNGSIEQQSTHGTSEKTPSWHNYLVHGCKICKKNCWSDIIRKFQIITLQGDNLLVILIWTQVPFQWTIYKWFQRQDKYLQNYSSISCFLNKYSNHHCSKKISNHLHNNMQDTASAW